MKNSPFFSVVIPTLNEEAYIGRLLDDLTQQTEPSLEVIVVDGGSLDATQDIIRGYQSRLTLDLLTSVQPNVSAQRNLGAGRSKGKYLVFFDADIQIPPRYLTQLKEQIQRHSGHLFTTYVRADSRDVYDEVIANFINRAVIVSIFIDRPFVGGYNFIVSKKAFTELHGFREDVVMSEDYDLSLRLFRAGYKLNVFKKPRAVFSLRRFRKEGRLAVFRKHAKAGVYFFTKGPITKELFSYPMGGGWYKHFNKARLNSQLITRADKYMKRFVKLFLETNI